MTMLKKIAQLNKINPKLFMHGRNDFLDDFFQITKQNLDLIY